MNNKSLTESVTLFALPIIGSRLFSSLSGFVAMLFIAQLGQIQLAAGALVTSLQITLFVIAWSLFFAVGVMIGKAHGANEETKIGKIMQHGALIAIGITVILTVIFWNVEHILTWFKQPAATQQLVTNYFHALSWGIFPSLLNVCFGQFFTGIGKPRIVLFWTMLGLPITLIPGYGLIFGHFGLPNLGMVGMAYATSAAYWIGLALMLIYVLTNKNYRKYHIFTLRHPIQEKFIKKILYLGTPITMQFGGELLALTTMTLLMGLFGTVALSAQQVILQINVLAKMVPIGLSVASGTLISQAFGAKKFLNIKPTNTAAIKVGLIYAAIIASLYLFCPKLFISFYLDIHDPRNQSIIYLATWFFGLSALSQTLDITRNITTGSLRGLHDTRVPMVYGILSTWILSLPIGYILGNFTALGPIGLRMGYPIGFGIGALLIAMRFRKKIKGTAPFIDSN